MGYDYQIGIIRAKESNLLKKSDWDRILDLISLRDTWNELVRIDLGYNEITNPSEIINNISKFYSTILTNHYQEIAGYFIDEDLKKSFLFEFDLFNLKLIYKQKFFNTINFENNFINSGYFKPQDFVNYLKDGIAINNLTDDFFSDIFKLLKDETTTLSPLNFDILLDEYLFNFRLQTAKKEKSDFLSDFWKIQIDFYNLNLLITEKTQNSNFIKNGFISIESWNEIKDKSIDDKINFLNTFGYKDIAQKAFLAENINTSDLEISEENYILEFCEKATAFSMSPEPIISYFYRRYCEIKNINRILYSRAFKLTNSNLAQQISQSYIF
jgi:vacuolar-type H+-ATPase subunit C/Vma6